MTEATSGVLVFTRHIRTAGYCTRGMYSWFPLHGIEMRRLYRGIPVEEFEATGCALGLTVARIAREEHNG